MKEFWQHFEHKDFIAAQKSLDELDSQAKQKVLAELFQRSQYSATPHSISVLFRELHDDKKFSDFHEAWFPPKDACHPETLYGKTYQQFFQAPIRVLNAVNINNPKEIVSIGLHWLNEEQAQHFAKMMGNAGKDDANQQRGDSIATVAKKTKSDVFMVQADDNLGTPF